MVDKLGRRDFLGLGLKAALVAGNAPILASCASRSAKVGDFDLTVQGIIRNVLDNNGYHFFHGVRGLGTSDAEICKIKVRKSDVNSQQASLEVVNAEIAPGVIDTNLTTGYLPLLSGNSGEVFIPTFDNPLYTKFESLYWSALEDRLKKEFTGEIKKDLVGNPVEPTVETKNEERRVISFYEWRDFVKGSQIYLSPNGNSVFIDLPGRMNFPTIKSFGEDWTTEFDGGLEKMMEGVKYGGKYNFGVLMNPHTGHSEGLFYGQHKPKVQYVGDNLKLGNIEMEYVGVDFDAGGGSDGNSGSGSDGPGDGSSGGNGSGSSGGE